MLNKTPTTKHLYRWIPDPKDPRDFSYLRSPVKSLPSRVDLSPRCPPVEDQGAMGSCTANALVGNLEYLELKESQDSQKSLIDLSRLFVYYNERVELGVTDEDKGANLRTGIKTLHKLGVCSENTWPYQQALLFEQPNAKAYAEAAQRCISKYERLQDLNDFKDCLAGGFPFVFGFVVFESFETKEVAQTGRVPLPKRGENILGGHAVMAVGYNEEKRVFLLRNSWGPHWGLNGYFTLPYEYLTDKNLAGDFWT